MSELFGNPDQTQSAEGTPAPEATSPQPEVKQVESSPSPDSLFADQLASITAEDGRQKYANVETALSSIPHAQQKIREQEQQLQELRKQIEQSQNMEKLLSQLEANTSPKSPAPTSEGTLDEAKLAELVEMQLKQRELNMNLEKNKNKVIDTLASKYGDKAKAEQAFIEKAKKLNMSGKDFLSMASSHPELVLSQFSDVETPTPSTVNGSVNTSGLKASPEPLKPVMFGATTKDVVNSFRQHAKN